MAQDSASVTGDGLSAEFDEEVRAAITLRLHSLFSGRRALILEDEIGPSLCKTLKDAGFAEVCLATRGEDALQLAESTFFDVLILDRINPGLEGLDVLERLRAGRGASACSPVLVFSLMGDETQRIHGLLRGAARDTPYSLARVPRE